MAAGLLSGKTIVLLESRMAPEMADLVRRQGGTPLSAPAMQEVPLPASTEIRSAIDEIIGDRYKMVVFLTGVGLRAFLEAGERLGKKDALLGGLRRTKVVCRGPKPVAVCRRNDMPVYLVAPEPNTSEDLLLLLSKETVALKGAHVLLQHYGVRNTVVKAGLEQMGARVSEVSLYAWALPSDTEPVRNAIDVIISGGADAVLFTSQQQARNLFQLAAEFGKADALRQALRGSVTVGAVGPVVTRTLGELGVIPAVVPKHPKMGPLVVALARHWEGTPDGAEAVKR